MSVKLYDDILSLEPRKEKSKTLEESTSPNSSEPRTGAQPLGSSNSDPTQQHSEAYQYNATSADASSVQNLSFAGGDDTQKVQEPAKEWEVEEDDEEDDACPPHFRKIMDVTEMETENGILRTKAKKFHKPKKTKDKLNSYMAICRKKVGQFGQTLSITLEIKSPLLRKAFAEVLSDIERLNLSADPILIPKPFEECYHRWGKMKDYFEKQRGRPAEEELSKIMEFMDLHLEAIRADYSRNVAFSRITSDIAWTLFPPGEVVVMSQSALPPNHPIQCYVVRDCRTTMNGLLIKCYMWQYDGTRLGKSTVTFKIPLGQGGGSYPIQDLPMYPLQHHPNYEKTKEELIERGHKYAKIVNRAHMDYDGVAWVQDVIDLEVIQRHVKGRVMIDYKEYIRQFPDSSERLDDEPRGETQEDALASSRGMFNSPMSFEYSQEVTRTISRGKEGENQETQLLEASQALLCPGTVRGFALVDKVWATFRVDCLKDIVWNSEAYKRLQMNTDMKEVISALVESHNEHSTAAVPEFDDIITGKGLGLVFLLQGPPGLGKTLTAESVAEQSHKPLYSVTSGELGTTVSEMEAALTKAFRIAKEWNAILLLDEADVFMSKRSAENLQKSAFVSVFLRLMEYYQGILFLTTNRAEDFDDAFISRIHLSVDYSTLDDGQRTQIWKTLTDNMDKDDTLDDKGFDELGKININGREIKNLLRTAWSLAKQNKKPLGLHHIGKVARINSRFSKVTGLDILNK